MAKSSITNFIDRSLKVIAKSYPNNFIQLVLGDTEIDKIVTIENPNINIREKRSDFVYKINDSFIVHIEFQLKHSKSVPIRIFKYNAFLTEVFRLPVISAVIYLEKHNYRNLPDSYIVKRNERVYHHFSYLVIKLWNYKDEIISGKFENLSPLLVMFIDATGEKGELERKKILELERKIILSKRDYNEKSDLLSLAVTIAGRYFNKEFLFDFFKEEVYMLKSSSIVEDWIKEGYKSGMEKGIQEGMEKGIQEGIEKGIQKGIEKGMEKGMEKGIEKGIEKGMIYAKCDAIINALKFRFGTPPPDRLLKKLKTINEIKQLDRLFQKAILSNSIAEFAAFVKNVKNSKNPKK